MAAHVTPTGALFEDDTVDESQLTEEPKEKRKYVKHIVWRNVAIFSFLHLGALYGLYLSFTSAKLLTTAFAILLYQLSILGVTAGVHRLWSHRAYKAKWPLQLLLMILSTTTYQDAVIDWSRDHRLHHKYSETDADPHNSKRGFFFSHIGWLLCRKHPEVKEKGKGIDLSDLKSNPILAFQKKYYNILMPLLCFISPTLIPVVWWNETWINAFYIPAILRYVLTLNITWLINSVAHTVGNKPYDKYICPADNKGVAIFSLGEGWHNYHHVFPWDYKTAELGDYKFNTTTAFINFFAKIGWAYDLKSVSNDMIRKRMERTGNSSHNLWGWSSRRGSHAGGIDETKLI
ncbi:PREDICTED: acyl-CoA Delta(11) desaturase-like [Vollenhovia emeryi]|uniref:acyl-CoA Delta(11) desaturase-like n=1 Tax=Vollenhovia emeryi TaxID=411798 RepID=UPI0005F56579|nr:PREDICTED: acyl-CoA Delta(11) desaturase-like [Vollenhovia emeryi]